MFANLVGTSALLTLARLRGVPAGELGLSSQRVAAGARAGATVGTPIMALWAGVALCPHRARLRDARVAGLSARAVGYQAAVRVPLGTAVWEEVAFRAVLPALLRRVMPARTAGVVNAVVFGLWHIRPTLDAISINGIATTRPRRSAAGAARSPRRRWSTCCCRSCTGAVGVCWPRPSCTLPATPAARSPPL